MSPPPAQTRRRACEACHITKVKCDTSAADPSVCERCWRAGHECTPAVPRRQRDRINALEARVRELTDALQSAELERRPPDSSDADKEALVEHQAAQTLAVIDKYLAKDVQQRALHSYAEHNVAALPAIPPPSLDIDQCRQKSPILLLSILAFPVTSVIPSDVQYNLIGEAMQLFGKYLIAFGNRSLEIVQALLVVVLYYRTSRRYASIFQLSRLAVEIAIDIGIAGPHILVDASGGHSTVSDPSSIDARRTWLATFLASSCVSLHQRRLDSKMWTPYHEECLSVLESSPDALYTDRALCQLVRAERLYHRIVLRLGLCDPEQKWDMASDDARRAISEMREEIDAHMVQSACPPEINRLPAIRMSRHLALVYLNEPVLHTATNTPSFAGPGVPWRISPDDFAAPQVTVEHVGALYALKDSCVAALHAFGEYDPAVLIAASPLFFISRMKYFEHILLKLYVTLTAPGNTYGRVLHRDELALEAHFKRIKALGAAMMAIDDTSLSSQIVAASAALDQWFAGYKDIVTSYELKVTDEVLFTTLCPTGGFAPTQLGHVPTELWHSTSDFPDLVAQDEDILCGTGSDNLVNPDFWFSLAALE